MTTHVPVNHLRKAVQDRKGYLINELLRYGYEPKSGETIENMTLSDLEQIHINVKCQFGKELTREMES